MNRTAIAVLSPAAVAIFLVWALTHLAAHRRKREAEHKEKMALQLADEKLKNEIALKRVQGQLDTILSRNEGGRWCDMMTMVSHHKHCQYWRDDTSSSSPTSAPSASSQPQAPKEHVKNDIIVFSPRGTPKSEPTPAPKNYANCYGISHGLPNSRHVPAPTAAPTKAAPKIEEPAAAPSEAVQAPNRSNEGPDEPSAMAITAPTANGPSHPAGGIDTAAPTPFTWTPSSVAVVMVDWQSYFNIAEGKGQPTSGGGFFVPGADVAPLKEALAPATEVLKVARAYGACVVHTSASRDTGTGLNLAGGVIPLAGELVVHHSPNAKGAFWNTNLEKELRGRGVTSLVVTGVTTDGCVQITMREANDRGFKCVVVEEATATYIPQYKELALDMISSPGGIGGRRCKLAEALHAFDPTSSLRLGTA